MAETNPFDNAILLNLDVHKLGDRRAVGKKTVEADVDVDTDKDLLKVSKKIFECDQYDAVANVIREMKAYLKTQSLPGARFIKGGVYAIPSELVSDVDTRLQRYQERFGEAVKDFARNYEAAVDEAMKRLKVLKDASDYPSPKKVKESFWLKWEYVAMGPPGKLQAVSAAIWEREKEKAAAQMQTAAGEVRDAMRQMFSELVGYMTEALGTSADGKKKVFRDSTVDKLKDFLGTFAAKDITGDAELAALVGNAKKLLSGVAPENLRKDNDLRAATEKGLSEIKSSMAKLIEDAPARKLILDD